jgi:hypothetical protein
MAKRILFIVREVTMDLDIPDLQILKISLSLNLLLKALVLQTLEIRVN